MAVKGKGTTVQVDTTTVSDVESVTYPQIGQDVEELQLVDDSADYAQKIPTRITYGQIKLRVAYDPTLHSALDALAEELLDPGETFTVTIGSQSYECVACTAGEITVEKTGILKREYTFEVQGPSGS